MKLTYNKDKARYEFRLKSREERDSAGHPGLALVSRARFETDWDWSVKPPTPIFWTKDVYRAHVLNAHADPELRQAIAAAVQARGGLVPVLTFKEGCYIWHPAIVEGNGIDYRKIVKDAGFVYCKTPQFSPPLGLPNGAGESFTSPVWWTGASRIAMKVSEYADEAAQLAIGEAMAKRERILAESRAEDSDITVQVPEGLEPFGYQRAGLAYASKRMMPSSPVRGVLFGDEMGLGKTIEAILLINYFADIKRVLVICPATLKRNWQSELQKWLVRPCTIGIGDTQFTQAVPNSDIVIVNYEMLALRTDTGKRKADGKRVFDHRLRASLKGPWDLVIVDEAHRLKGDPKTVVRSRMVLEIAAKRWAMLTGTPMVNRPRELWNIINHLAPNHFKDKGAFLHRYCTDGQKMRRAFGRVPYNGARNLEELQEKLRTLIMVRRLKRDVLKDLPPKLRQVIELPADSCGDLVKQEALAFSAKEDAMTALRLRVELAKASDDPDHYRDAVGQLKKGIQVAFTDLSRIRRETAVAKAPVVSDHVEGILSEGHKVILFCHHKEVVAEIAKQFSIECVTVTGDTPVHASCRRGKDCDCRHAAVTRFQEDDDIRLFVGTIGAAGVGLTLTASSYVVFAELDWVPGNVTQAEDRAHRIGQKDSVLIQHLVLEGSLDKRMADVLVEKQEIADRALDRDRADLLDDPVTPEREAVATQGVTQRQVAALAEQLSKDDIATVHYGLRLLAGAHKDAHLLDGLTFRAVDAPLGTHLAQQKSLTPKLAALGRKFLTRYRHTQLASIPEIKQLFERKEN